MYLSAGSWYAARVTTGPARALLRRLGQYLDGFSACFSRQPQRDAATQYLDGLFNDSERKSMQAMHGRLGDPGRLSSAAALHHPFAVGRGARLDAAARHRAHPHRAFWPSMTRAFPSRARSRPACNGSTAARSEDRQLPSGGVECVDRRRPHLAAGFRSLSARRRGPTIRRAVPAAGIPPTLRFREKWRIALAQVRTVLQAGFTITGRRRRRRLRRERRLSRRTRTAGLAYGVAIRGEATFAVAGVPGDPVRHGARVSAPDDAWETVTWGTGTAGPLTARFCALRVRPTAGRGDRWLLCERSATDERKYYLLHLSGDHAAGRPGRARAQPLAHRTAVSRAQGRSRPRSLRRADVSGLDASRRSATRFRRSGISCTARTVHVTPRGSLPKCSGRSTRYGAAVVVPALTRALATGTPLLLAVTPARSTPACVALDAVPAPLRDIAVTSGCAADYDGWLLGGAA